MKRTMLLFGAAILIFAGPPLIADESDNQKNAHQPDFTSMTLEQLLQVQVVSASKFPQRAVQAPSSVTVITAEEINRYGYRTVAEILRGVRSFFINNDRNYTYLGIRGFNRPGDLNTRILLLLNGHRINDPVYAAANMDFNFPVDVDAIERVEIVRGPSSSLYGTNAFFAVVNVITKSGLTLNKIEASAEKWSFGTSKAGFNAGTKLNNGLDLTFSGSFMNSNGQDWYYPEFDSPATNNGLAVGSDYEKARKGLARLSFEDFSFQIGYVTRKKGVPTGAFDTVYGDPRTYTIDELAFADLSYRHDFTARTSIASNINYDWYAYNGSWQYDQHITQTDLARGERWGAEVKIDQKLATSHLLSFGAEFRDDFKILQRTYDSNAEYLNDNRPASTMGIYLQDEFKVDPKLTLNLGLRHDRYRSFGSTTNPRLAAILNPKPSTTIKVLYGQAFRAPNAYEMYYQDGMSQLANPRLSPERIRTAELAWEQQVGQYLDFILSGYHYWIRGLISQQESAATGYLMYTNLGDVDAAGLESEVSGKWGNGFMGNASFSVQDANDRLTGHDLTNLPRRMLKFRFSGPLVRNKLYAGLQTDYMSRRGTVSDSFAGSRWLADLVFSSQSLIPGFDFTFGIYNLLNERYGDPASGEHRQDLIFQDGRSIRLRLSYAFKFKR